MIYMWTRREKGRGGERGAPWVSCLPAERAVASKVMVIVKVNGRKKGLSSVRAVGNRCIRSDDE